MENTQEADWFTEATQSQGAEPVLTVEMLRKMSVAVREAGERRKLQLHTVRHNLSHDQMEKFLGRAQPTNSWLHSLYGIPVRLDECLPPGGVAFFDGEGTLIGFTRF